MAGSISTVPFAGGLVIATVVGSMNPSASVSPSTTSIAIGSPGSVTTDSSSATGGPFTSMVTVAVSHAPDGSHTS